MSTNALDEPMPRWWQRPVNLGDLLEWGPLVVALVVYAIADNPALAVALACLKFAAEDFRTAAWIRAVDPDVPRRRATAWFHRALGMSKVAFFGIVAIALTGAVFSAIQPAQLGQGPIQLLLVQAFGGLMMAMAASLVSSLLAVVGTVTAVRHRLRIWVDWRASRARIRETWPPSDPRPDAPMRNLLVLVLLGNLTGASLIGLMIGTYFVTHQAILDSLEQQLLLGGLGVLCVALTLALLWAVRVVPAPSFELCYPEPRQSAGPTAADWLSELRDVG